MSDDPLPYGVLDGRGLPLSAFAMGHCEMRTPLELREGDLVWHPQTLLYRPVVGVRYRMDARWEIQLQGGHRIHRPDRTVRDPEHVTILVGAGPEYLRRANNGLGAPPQE
jgi:hypothetical protein